MAIKEVGHKANLSSVSKEEEAATATAKTKISQKVSSANKAMTDLTPKTTTSAVAMKRNKSSRSARCQKATAKVMTKIRLDQDKTNLILPMLINKEARVLSFPRKSNSKEVSSSSSNSNSQK